ncbi:MAG TPA: branched-chain amino acid ABC transporter permease [Dehalococcoidia bacterium]|nr:branched-chain amino acid ABC transporter permease [Dehalococcoidia bacterium]
MVRTAALAAAAGLACMPPLAGGYSLHLGLETVTLALAAMSLGLLVGWGGMVSLGHAAFWGLGAYAAALLSTHIGPWPWLVLPVAAMVPAAFAVATGIFTLRSHGIFFLMLTLAFAQLAYVLALQWRGLTNGDNGISGIPGLAGFQDHRALYGLAVAFLGAGYLFLSRLVRSPVGQVLDAARQNEARTRALGYPVFTYRLAAYALAAAMTGLAGAVAAHERGFVHPRDFYWVVSGVMLVVVLLGGRRALWGPIVGASLYVAVGSWASARTEFWNLVLGLLLVGVVLWGRGGIAGLAGQAWQAAGRFQHLMVRGSNAGAARRARV